MSASEASSEKAAPVMVDPDDLGLMLFCALSPDRYLPGRSVSVRYWDELPRKWKDIINTGGISTPWKDRRLEDKPGGSAT